MWYALNRTRIFLSRLSLWAGLKDNDKLYSFKSFISFFLFQLCHSFLNNKQSCNKKPQKNTWDPCNQKILAFNTKIFLFINCNKVEFTNLVIKKPDWKLIFLKYFVILQNGMVLSPNGCHLQKLCKKMWRKSPCWKTRTMKMHSL